LQGNKNLKTTKKQFYLQKKENKNRPNPSLFLLRKTPPKTIKIKKK
jgi:hypothetical protein